MDYIRLYVDFLKKHAAIKRPLKVVCDSSNGATGKILEMLLPELGLAEFTLLNSNPDPDFAAHGPNPLLPGATDELKKAVKDKKADIGVIFDADGDRAFFIDANGNSLPSFVIAAMLFGNGQAPFVSDELVFLALRHCGLFPASDLHPSRVGFFFIKQKMKEVGGTIGAEFSGHYCFRDFFLSDSGLFAMIRVLSILSASSTSLSEFQASLPVHSVRNDDLRIEGKDWQQIKAKLIAEYAKEGATIEERDGVSISFEHGWLNARTSNTEPTLRLYAGAATDADALKLLDGIKKLV